jgi:hypothetical protein
MLVLLFLVDVPRKTIYAPPSREMIFTKSPNVPRETSCIYFRALLSFRPRGFGGEDYRCGQSKGWGR